jgi:hypothetical protein
MAVALLAGVTVSCSTPSGGGGLSPAQQFCEFWDKVEEAPPTDESAVLVKEEVVALADDTAVTGSSCTDPNAKVDLDGAVLAEGDEIPSEQGNAASEPIAAITGDEIAAGAPVLENVSVQALSATIGPNGITLRGNVRLQISGTTSTIGFVGTLRDLDNWSVSLSSSSLTIPGITTTPATFSGTLRMSYGVPSLSLEAGITSAKVGDVTVNGASLSLQASPATGVKADVAGTIKVGPSNASGVVHVEFDRAGALVDAHAEITARLVGTQAGGKKIDLQGNVRIDGNSQETAASFSGSGVLGDLVVNEANGSLTLATNKATFVGVLDIQQGASSVRFNGAIVWDGSVAYAPTLDIQAEGEFSGTLDDGQAVTAAGSLSTTVVNGQVRTVVTGNFKVGSLKATGEAVLETNGATTVLNLDAGLVDAGFDAQLQGVVVITDGRAETVSIDAAVNGTVDLGDVTLTGAQLHIASTYGSPLEVSFSGGLQVGSRANMNGSVTASIGPNGTLLSLNGQLNGSMLLDGWGIANFQGSVVAGPTQVTLTGSGSVSVINFPAAILFNGSFTSSLTEPTWSLNGTGRFRIASIDVASARLSLSQTAGMRATRVGFYFAILGIPTYFEGNFYMNSTGGCSRVDITGGSLLAKPLLALALPGVVGCPVNI